MPAPYFQQPWPSFTYQGYIYQLHHLDEYEVSVTDSKKVERRIVVTFHDHCFTESPSMVNVALNYPASDRNPGHFCFVRYNLSLDLRKHIASAISGRIWNVDGDNYAIVPTVDHEGNRIHYGIVFSLDRVRGLPVDLHLRIKSAYPVNEKPLVTFGFLEFRHLVTLRMEKKTPKKDYSTHRKKPQLR